MKTENKPIEISKTIGVKICGMREIENIVEIAALKPTYLGFIFAKSSPRYFQGAIPEMPKSIQKVGVFVGETIENVLKVVSQHELQAVQLHGNESVTYCKELKEVLDGDIKIIKVFSVGTDFDFEELQPFEKTADYFLLDTKGKWAGGNGTQFDWQILKQYNSQKPFFLSGGIGVEDVKAIQKLRETNLPLHAVDCNSKLEISVGLKNKKQCEELLESFTVNYKNEL
ncbi:phosphoribosylanthranilate isomerase [Flavobacterium antarcticum]|uniref:phosphoribosylanthranilate isomerase n=1 Tax=Flavobacterium antarcticum TaxID=271155 RepID=UPI0003B66364|nr:phosphoribosylanthranilate isomerase [Flavobacterium antarcticum]